MSTVEGRLCPLFVLGTLVNAYIMDTKKVSREKVLTLTTCIESKCQWWSPIGRKSEHGEVLFNCAVVGILCGIHDTRKQLALIKEMIKEKGS